MTAVAPKRSTSVGWPDPSELRVGLGCMRLPMGGGDEQAAVETIVAAAEAGITVFDTARTYGLDARDAGHNERLVARALRSCSAHERARIVTKGGMRRAGDHWIPDGRAKAIRADCEASLAALDGLAIDMYLIHAPDRETPWRTTLRALAGLAEEGLVRRVGVANVNRRELEEALDVAEIAAVQVALSAYDERAIRGGLVEFCERRGITLMAHSPLGGPRRAAGLSRRQALGDVATRRGATPPEVALAWLLDVSPVIFPIPGARRPESARSAARAAKLRLHPDDRAVLADAFGSTGRPRTPRLRSRSSAEVVVVMGIPGAGKSRLTKEYSGRGFIRLNRDDLGGSLREVASTLDQRLSSGARRFVLDNTYLTRPSRSYVIEAAARHRAPVRCIWLDTPLAQAQVNLVHRLLDRFGRLPSPEEIRQVSRREPWIMLPTSQMRALRELEPPGVDEGFADVEVVPFSRAARSREANPAVFVSAAAMSRRGSKAALEQSNSAVPHLIFDWIPDGTPAALKAAAARLSKVVSGAVEHAVCPHRGGPPSCWCRPPLPGLPLAFARAHGLDPARSTLIGTAPAHRTLATTLGAEYLPV